MKKILIIRFSSIGDIVLTSPVTRCLKEQIPGAEIHYLTKKQYAPLLSSDPHIDRLWLYDGSFAKLIPELKKERFDFIVDLHRNLRSFYVRMQLRKPSGSFPKLNIRKWLRVRFRVDLLPAIHIVDRYFHAVKKLGVGNDGKGLEYFIPPADEVGISTLLPDGETKFTVIVIGGKHVTKIFPAEKVAEVCNRIPYPVILLGGAEDRDRGDWIVAHTDRRVVNACGRLSLNQAASVVRQAESVLSNDTGYMHVAAAFRKKIVSVWGNTIPEFGMYPYLPEELKEQSFIAEVKNLNCRPCSKLGYKECPRAHFRCMKDINVEEIIARL